MVLNKIEFNEDYYYGRHTGIKYRWGYGDIKEQGKFGRVQEQFAKIDYDFTEKSVLDVGGAIGNDSIGGKERGASIWNVLDLNINSWCENNKVETVDRFITGDAREALKIIASDSYDVVFSYQFLECIADEDLSSLIDNMNRIGKTQIHFVSNFIQDEITRSKYNVKTLEEWAKLGFAKGSIFVDTSSDKVVIS